jgi:hypothetical protein
VTTRFDKQTERGHEVCIKVLSKLAAKQQTVVLLRGMRPQGLLLVWAGSIWLLNVILALRASDSLFAWSVVEMRSQTGCLRCDGRRNHILSFA